jgi:hypothetical protein
MYIVWGNNIFAHRLTLVQFAAQPQARMTGAGDKGQLRKDDDSLNRLHDFAR